MFALRWTRHERASMRSEYENEGRTHTYTFPLYFVVPSAMRSEHTITRYGTYVIINYNIRKSIVLDTLCLILYTYVYIRVKLIFKKI